MKWTHIVSLAVLVPLVAFGAASRDSDFKGAMASKPNLDNGEALFEQCVSCHGRDGGGNVTGSIPRIAGQHYRVLVRQIIDFRYGRRWDARMEGVMAEHSVLAGNQDIADVAAYVSKLERDGARGVGDGQYVERGAALYAKGCASCHGASAEGDESRGIPRLAGQHADYAYAQLQAFKAGDRGADKDGKDAQGKIMAAIAQKMSDAQMKAVTDYAAGLR